MSINKNVIVCAACSLISFLTGAFIGIKAAKKHYDSEGQKFYEFEGTLEETVSNDNEEPMEDVNDISVKNEVVKQDERVNHYKPKPDLFEMSKKYITEAAEKYNDEDLNDHILEREHPEEDADEDDAPIMLPYEIDESEVGDFPEFDNCELTYYAREDILCDEQNELVEDRRGTIGGIIADALPLIHDESVIYCVNHRDKAIYVITIDREKSYYGY